MATSPSKLAVVRPSATPAPAPVPIAPTRTPEFQARDRVDRTNSVLTRLEKRAADYSREIARLQKRKSVACSRICRIENATLEAMEKANVTKADGWSITFTARTCPPSVEVFNESAIQPEYIRTKEVTSPDKHAIREALEAQIAVGGCRLIQNVSLVRK